MGVVALAERPGLLKWLGFFTLVPLTNYSMTQSSKKPWLTNDQLDRVEYSHLKNLLNKDDLYMTPEERSLAVSKYKELRAKITRAYIDSRGL